MVGPRLYVIVSQPTTTNPQPPTLPLCPSVVEKALNTSMFTLGTAQLGLPKYGRTNAVGCPPEAEAVAFVRAVVASGVGAIDTARAYGLAEERVGKAIEDSDSVTVITKLSPMAWLPAEVDEEVVRAAVEASVFQSCHALRLRCLPVLMLHRWAHHDSHGGLIWAELLRLKEHGVIEALGASVYTPEEALAALADPDVRHLQIPFNLLDHRWRSKAFLRARTDRPDVFVFGRSVFLQGVLLAGPGDWPRVAGWDAGEVTAALDRLVAMLGRESRVDLCLAYVRSDPQIDSVVLGMETMAQFEANLRLFGRPPLAPEERERVESVLPQCPDWVLDPGRW